MAWSDDALLIRRLRAERCGRVYRPGGGLRAAACRQTGEIFGLYAEQDCPVAELEGQGALVLELAKDDSEHILRFALRELAAAGGSRLGACGEMRLRVASATGLCKLMRQAEWPEELTFGRAYVALQREVEAIWRDAAEALRAGRPWTRDDWVPQLDGIAPLAWEKTARLLMGYGLILPPGGASLKRLAPMVAR